MQEPFLSPGSLGCPNQQSQKTHARDFLQLLIDRRPAANPRARFYFLSINCLFLNSHLYEATYF